MPSIDRHGVEIYYEVHGQGPVVLMSHGYGATSAMWRGQLEALGEDHTLVTWDLRGHGQSGSPEDESEYSARRTVEDMAAILDALGGPRHDWRALPRRIHVVGVSSRARGAGQRIADRRHRARIPE